MRIASICASISHFAGGIAPAVRGLNRALDSHGLYVTTHAAQDAVIEESRGEGAGLSVRLHPTIGRGQLTIQRSLVMALQTEQAQVVHVHGLWLYPSWVARKYPKPGTAKIISPHGMLDGWALQNSAWKKRIALLLFERANLESATCLHALNLAEYDAIREAGFTQPVAIVPNGVDVADFDGNYGPPPWAHRIPEGCKVLLYLGRIHPKKGIDRLISAISLLKPYELGQWHLVIAGWDDGGSQRMLETQAEASGVGNHVHFVGPQFGKGKGESFARADAFILPSLSEGLPIVVLEAFAFGIPVLMTAASNMPECFAAGAAIRIGTEAADIADDLKIFFRMPETDSSTIGLKGRRLVETDYSWHSAACKMKEVYLWSIGESSMPSCVVEQ